ncbi:MAG: DNA polymerase domain-containing protein, partial [Candidatus Bathyarchaeia archaeon]
EPVAAQSSGTHLHHCGRIFLDLSTYEWIGVAGVVERSRFTMAPPELSAKWQAGRTIDSRQSYEALKRGILLPEKKSFYNYGMTARDIVFRDRGGLLLAPEAGLHENVGELDFESMFPNIIERFNVSYETVTPEAVDNSFKGFLGQLTKRFLDRRLYFKHMRKEYPRESMERLWCEQRQTALKGILVCIYGFSACFANRFGNIAVYQEINRIARQVLLRSINVALEDGFNVVYGDTDSLFLKKTEATQKDYEQLAAKISRETGLPIALDHHYKFLVFLSQESMPEMEATRRYFGKLTDGELYYRGIDLRRHDTPPFLKEFQEKLMEIFFDAENAHDVERMQYRKACDFVMETCHRIQRGEVDPTRLTVIKVLRKPVNEYRSMLPHVAAAKQIEMRGTRLTDGETVNFLYVNAGHSNPYRRVVSIPMQGRSYYDKERYVELALDVAETVLGAFGFRKHQEALNCKLTDWR